MSEDELAGDGLYESNTSLESACFLSFRKGHRHCRAFIFTL